MWIWIIIFLPVVGSLAYIFMEMMNTRRFEGSSFANIFASKPSIRRLEENLRFSDTFNNRVMLADGYFENNELSKAIELYNSSLTGAFEENEYVHTQLLKAFSATGQFEKVVSIGKKLYHLPTFPRSRAHMLYAMALDQLGRTAEAEKEFRMMQARFSFYEARYQFGLLLIRHDRREEAKQLYLSMLEESGHLSARERRSANLYFKLIREKLKEL
jgi:hypothetical protein